MIYIPVRMAEMPKSCAECTQNRKSNFANLSACNVTRSSNAGFQGNERPKWCPLREAKS